MSRGGGGPDNVLNHQRISERAERTSREMQLNPRSQIVCQEGPHQNLKETYSNVISNGVVVRTMDPPMEH